MLKHNVNKKVRIVFLGGVGEVTKNMFVYEYLENGQIVDILIVDCGVGFSEDGKELLLPDPSYLLDKKDKIRGIVLTHGHEDHTSALFAVLPEIGNVPVYGTRLTVALAATRLEEHQLRGDLRKVDMKQTLNLGNFKVNYVHMTHSIPDAANMIIKTPIGTFYHGSDFKFDWMPLDGWQSEVGKIARAGDNGILCLLSDCVRSEREGYTLSELFIEEELEKQVRKARGRVIFTTQSSNISRIQQAINVALRFKRKLIFLGRSVRKNVEVTEKLGYLRFPQNAVIRKRDVRKYPDNKLFLIVAGSQAQEDSALTRLIDDKNEIKLKPNDRVVFSADPIPGYERQVHNLIDRMTLKGARVIYNDINDALHVSGHGSQNDLMLMIGLTRPKLLLPIGGSPRHVKQYSLIAQKMGFQENQILTPQENDAMEFDSFGSPRLLKNFVPEKQS